MPLAGVGWGCAGSGRNPGGPAYSCVLSTPPQPPKPVTLVLRGPQNPFATLADATVPGGWAPVCFLLGRGVAAQELVFPGSPVFSCGAEGGPQHLERGVSD